MVLVDTSVWIDFFRGKDTRQRHELHRLIEQGAGVKICGVVLQEILQGVGSELECRRTKKYLLEFAYLTLKEPSVFEMAADIYKNCRKRGKTVRKPVDCIIAAVAMEYDVRLFHHDADFDRIAECNQLKIYAY